MAITLNLLPQENQVSGSLAKFLKFARTFGVIALALFMLYVVGVGAFLYINTTKINGLTSDTDSLKSQIANLDTSEKQVFLLKDRIKQISTVQTVPSSLKNLTSVMTLIQNLSPTARVTELDTDSKKVDLSVNFKSNFDMAAFLDSVKSSALFNSVIVSSFGLSPTSGYLISFNLTTK